MKSSFTEINNSFCEINNSEQIDSLDVFKINLDNNNAPVNNLFHNQNGETSTKRKLGRKPKNAIEKGNHTRNKIDNMIRKVKVITKNALKDHINSKCKQTFSENRTISINGKKYIIQLLNIKHDKVKQTNVKFNQNMLNEKVGDFFSEEVSSNYSNHPKNFNELLIHKLYELEKAKEITDIFEKTYLECLKYFRMDKDVYNNPKYSCLKGLEKYFQGLEENLLLEGYDREYINKLKDLINNFEIVYREKKARKPRKNKITN